jgi:hypothetical protein
MMITLQIGESFPDTIDDVPVRKLYEMLLDSHCIIDDEFVGLGIAVGDIQYLVQMDDSKIYIQKKDL